MKVRDGGYEGSTPELKRKAKVGDIRSGQQFGWRSGERADSSYGIECSLIDGVRARASFDFSSPHCPIRSDLDTDHYGTGCLAGSGSMAGALRLVDLRDESRKPVSDCRGDVVSGGARTGE
jgi:hypothetical protein